MVSGLVGLPVERRLAIPQAAARLIPPRPARYPQIYRAHRPVKPPTQKPFAVPPATLHEHGVGSFCPPSRFPNAVTRDDFPVWPHFGGRASAVPATPTAVYFSGFERQPARARFTHRCIRKIFISGTRLGFPRFARGQIFPRPNLMIRQNQTCVRCFWLSI